MSYKLQFINSARFMTRSLTNLANNLAKIHEVKYKYQHDDKKFETCGIRCKDFDCFFESGIWKGERWESRQIHWF